MHKIDHLYLAIALGLLSAPFVSQAHAQGYDYETIDYPGASSTSVFGVNERGDAVGGSSAGPRFVYDTDKGTFTVVEPVAGFDFTGIIGISDSGDLVGSVSVFNPLKQSGLILDKNGTATIFDHPEAVSSTTARAINANGLVTGIRDSESSSGVGFIYDPRTDTFTDIVPSFFTIAQGINSRGDVVGSAIYFGEDDPCPGSGGRYGWLRTKDGNVTYFTVNGASTRARGISDSGTIVGFMGFPFKGFVVELDGTQCQDISIAEEDLLSVPGSNFTIAQGITNSGKITGFYEDATFNQHGFVATPQ